MRKSILLLLLFICTTLFAQTDKSILLGIRNSQFLQVGYSFNDQTALMIENTLFVRELDAQYIRIKAKFTKYWEAIQLNATLLPYVGSNYVGQFYDLGLEMGLRKTIWEKTSLNAGVIPIYDSAKGYRTCYEAGLGYRFLNELSLQLKATDYPEFRTPEHRISGGILFSSGNLHVNPMLSVPLKGDIRTSRVLISFLYTLNLKK